MTVKDEPTPTLPVKLPIPTTSNALVGEDVPIPTLPESSMLNCPADEPTYALIDPSTPVD